MPIADDISIDRATGNIRYTGTTDNYTVIELHRFLQDLADDAVSSGNDEIDITDPTPSARSTDNIITLLNGFNIDDTLAQHLYDGSIVQAGGATIYDGIVNFGNAGVRIEVVQNGALLTNFWTTGLNADANQGISHRFLVKVRDGGADIDGRRLLGFTREFGQTYAEFRINGTSRGNNVLALSNGNDLNNNTAEGTVAANIGDFTNTEGLRSIDVDNNGTPEDYYSEWVVGGAFGINDLYEATKWLARRGSSSTLYGLNGQLFRGITHSIPYDGETGGPWTQPETLTFGNGATAQLLAVEDDGATGTLHVQLLTGVAPADNDSITGGTSGATALVNGTPTERTVSPTFLGQSTGSAIIGAFGVGVALSELGQADLLTALDNVARNPPNLVSFNVLGLVSGEDRVLVGPEDGAGGLDVDQLSTSGTLTGAAVTTVDVTTPIPSDTPSSGTIRIQAASGTFLRVPYSSFTGSTFTIPAFDFSGDNVAGGANVYVSYIDTLAGSTSESFTSIYLADRTLFVRVRDGGGTPIVTFETTGTLGTGGGSATAIRTSDA
ncbi:MAG: hypothetical protein AAGH15_13685 [Myxococcota bacterium]